MGKIKVLGEANVLSIDKVMHRTSNMGEGKKETIKGVVRTSKYKKDKRDEIKQILNKGLEVKRKIVIARRSLQVRNKRIGPGHVLLNPTATNSSLEKQNRGIQSRGNNLVIYGQTSKQKE